MNATKIPDFNFQMLPFKKISFDHRSSVGVCRVIAINFSGLAIQIFLIAISLLLNLMDRRYFSSRKAFWQKPISKIGGFRKYVRRRKKSNDKRGASRFYSIVFRKCKKRWSYATLTFQNSKYGRRERGELTFLEFCSMTWYLLLYFTFVDYQKLRL